MSSIYKKGRDGYFYYQTYLYNAKSNKKDKKIFHSLGTKNRKEAEEKKIQLDLKYNKKKKKYKTRIHNIFTKKKIFFFLILIMVNVYLSFQLVQKQAQLKTKELQLIAFENKDNYKELNFDLQPPNPMNEIETDTLTKVTKTKNEIKKEKTPKTGIPKYEIIRSEILSGGLLQHKIYVTVNNDTDKESQLLLCRKIKENFKESPNVVICIYTDDEFGIGLANGETNNINVDQKKKSWLAMFTYNSVEGEYFDENPSDYLGIY